MVFSYHLPSENLSLKAPGMEPRTFRPKHALCLSSLLNFYSNSRIFKLLGVEGRALNPTPTLPFPEGFLTEQVTACDAPFSDRDLHGTDGRREDVRLLEDLRQEWSVEGAEGRRIVLFCPFVQFKDCEFVPPGLRVPVLILR